MAYSPRNGRGSDNDRTKVLRTPQPGMPASPVQGQGGSSARPRSYGVGAYPVPGGQPTPPPREGGWTGRDDRPRAVSRVYGRARSGGGGGPVQPLSGGSGGGRGKRRPIGKIVLGVLAALVALLLVGGVAVVFWVNGRLITVDGVLDDYEGRPADTPGENWLLVGSDSRKGLSKAQRKKLATGRAAGQRTDTMMLLHIPEGDHPPTLVSLPRDSLVSIPGKGRNKLNAAYAFGGPTLLVRTVENVTGLRIDNYMEVGFAGFVDIVDAVGGVHICVKQNIKDPKAGINLKKGCQDMDGGTALGYVRTRATGALPDLDRTQRQRQFFSALVKKASSPGVLLNPFTALPLASAATDSVRVDDGTGAFDLLGLGLAMGDSPVTTSVPIAATPTLPGIGSVVQWNREQALELFKALEEDRPVPKSVLKAAR